MTGAVSEAVVVLDHECHVVHVNAAGQRLLGAVDHTAIPVRDHAMALQAATQPIMASISRETTALARLVRSTCPTPG